MFKRKQAYFWALPNNKKIIVEEDCKKNDIPTKEFKNIIKQEENLD
jgi:hypothetical protein